MQVSNHRFTLALPRFQIKTKLVQKGLPKVSFKNMEILFGIEALGSAPYTHLQPTLILQKNN